MKQSLLVAFVILFSQQSCANDQASQILQAQDGIWKGELYYLDYQSGQRFGIPMQIDAQLTPDGATLIRRLTYTDPGVLVHAVSVSTLEQNGELVEAFFRENNGEMLRYKVDSVKYKSQSDWTIIYSQEGTDDDRPASIRHTLKRDGDILRSGKEVRFLDGDEDRYILRNGIEVRLRTDAE